MSPLRIYVAGSSADMARAEKWMAKLREAGHTVVSSWPEVIRKVGSANPMTAPRDQRAEWALTDIREVEQANVFWLLLPEVPSAGAYTEFGISVILAMGSMRATTVAQELGVEVPPYLPLVSGKETSIFTALVPHFETDEQAFAFINTEMVKMVETLEAANRAAADDADDDAEEPPLPPGVAEQLDAIFAKAK